jgi:hypothetical protein
MDRHPAGDAIDAQTKFARTAKYKTKLHATAINTNQIAIFANLGT